MNKGRLEAFSDGVLAIIITIMVLELKIPHGRTDFSVLIEMIPIFVSYLLSFIYIGIYWNNHHHMLHSTNEVNGTILWANLHLLFWLSLVPFSTGWMGENHFAKVTLAVYGFVLLMAAIAYFILQRLIIKQQGEQSILKKAIKSDYKGKVSIILYLGGIISSFYFEWVAGMIYIGTAMMWFIPDSRIEHEIVDSEE